MILHTCTFSDQKENICPFHCKVALWHVLNAQRTSLIMVLDFRFSIYLIVSDQEKRFTFLHVSVVVVI